MGITWLADAEIGADEIRRNAARGFRSVTLPERPHRIGFPSIFTDYWDPIIAACAETDTVISLHVGSSGMADYPEGAPPLSLGATLFGQLSLTACAEWLWSAWAVRYPNLKIAMSEGGIGWVGMLIDRLDNIVDRSGYGMEGFNGLRPADVLRDHFWFCTLDDPSTIDTRYAHRRRPHHARDRLPARRRHVARLPGRRREVLGSPAGRGAAPAHAPERGEAVPAPAARGLPPLTARPSASMPSAAA